MGLMPTEIGRPPIAWCDHHAPSGRCCDRRSQTIERSFRWGTRAGVRRERPRCPPPQATHCRRCFASLPPWHQRLIGRWPLGP